MNKKIFKIFLIILLVFTMTLPNINVKAEDSNILDGVEDTAEIDFYERAEKVYTELTDNGSNVNLMVLGATVHMTRENSSVGYDYFTEKVIRQLFKYMNENPNIGDDEIINYSEDAYKKNIKELWLEEDIFKKYNYSDKKKDDLVEQIYTNIEVYKYLFGIEENTSSGNGTCSYKVRNKDVTNVKVRLLYCDGSGPIESEELIDFEDYIIGVVWQENGSAPYEALKAQAVAARSYALERTQSMNGEFGIGLKEENGSWIVSLRSCTNDQVFCNPSKGCWSNVTGGETNGSASCKNCTVYSGYDASKNWTRKSLEENSKVRKAVEETRGQVVVDTSGKVVGTDFKQKEQTEWNKLAKEGKDYFEILKKTYSKMSTIKADCSSTSANTEAETWKQYDERWGGQYIGTKTIKQIGCMVTSTSIQIARSGTKLNVSNFDPGVFVKTVKANNGFNNNDFNVNDSSWASIAPNFKVGGVINFSGSRDNKIKQMQNYITGNNYLIIRLYHPGQHWVAVTGIENGKIKIADPGSKATDFESEYNIATVTKGYYFVKKD